MGKYIFKEIRKEIHNSQTTLSVDNLTRWTYVETQNSLATLGIKNYDSFPQGKRKQNQPNKQTTKPQACVYTKYGAHNFKNSSPLPLKVEKPYFKDHVEKHL